MANGRQTLSEVYLSKRALKIFMIGVGGQGSITASKIIGESALREGHDAVLSEIHGMSQRGGIVESSVIIGKRMSPMIDDGEADIILGFEPMETLRCINKASAETVIITNTNPIIPYTVALGQGAYPEVEKMLGIMRSRAARLIPIDAFSLAKQAGSSMASNAVLLGALCALERFFLSSETVLQVFSEVLPERLIQVNRDAFELGYKTVRERPSSTPAFGPR
jgi:indolepyruvate ferredoxin oxidoreductase, beta subunit